MTSKVIKNSTIATILLSSALFQLLLALAQVYLGHSIGGLMYYFGERMVSVGSSAVAMATFLGNVTLRAYGSFSHPNILAGWLVIVTLIISKLSPSRHVLMLSSFVTTVGILLTQSRSAALAFFGLVVPLSLLKSFRSRVVYFLLLVCSLFVISNLFSRPTDLSLSERRSLQAVSLNVISHFPLFGTGAGASISSYPSVVPTHRLLQPDHNSLTLLLSWFGIFGIIVLFQFYRSSHLNLKVLLPLLPLLLLDHYLLTSPQGLFILLLYLKDVN